VRHASRVAGSRLRTEATSSTKADKNVAARGARAAWSSDSRMSRSNSLQQAASDALLHHAGASLRLELDFTNALSYWVTFCCRTLSTALACCGLT